MQSASNASTAGAAAFSQRRETKGNRWKPKGTGGNQRDPSANGGKPGESAGQKLKAAA